MTDKTLSVSISGLSGIQTVTVSESHDASTAMATINCHGNTKDVGDALDITLGYVGNTGHVFSGYVKKVEKSTPDGLWTISAYDDLIRACDFFIVGPGPNEPFTYRNISAENLIGTVLGMAGLGNFDFDPTYFTFGIENDVEVNLVSSYDYARMISDIIAYGLWCDRTGVIKLKNRKPYPMDGTSQQPGDYPDTPIATITDPIIMSETYGWNEHDLRNKIVVYGEGEISASASKATSLDPLTGTYRQILPAGFFKAAVLASPLIDNASMAQDAAKYNLHMLNKLTYEIPIVVEGNPILEARYTVNVVTTKGGFSGEFYIYQLEHIWGSGGYTTSMVLRM